MKSSGPQVRSWTPWSPLGSRSGLGRHEVQWAPGPVLDAMKSSGLYRLSYRGCQLLRPRSCITSRSARAMLNASPTGIESRWGTKFSAPVQTGPGAHPASCTMDIGSFPGVKCGRGVLLTTHTLLVPWSRKSIAIPLLPLWANGLYRASVPVQRCTLPYVLLGHSQTVDWPSSEKRLFFWERLLSTNSSIDVIWLDPVIPNVNSPPSQYLLFICYKFFASFSILFIFFALFCLYIV